MPASAQGTLLGQSGATDDRSTVLFVYILFTVVLEGRRTGTEGPQVAGPSIETASFIKQLTALYPHGRHKLERPFVYSRFFLVPNAVISNDKVSPCIAYFRPQNIGGVHKKNTSSPPSTTK